MGNSLFIISDIKWLLLLSLLEYYRVRALLLQKTHSFIFGLCYHFSIAFVTHTSFLVSFYLQNLA